MWLAFAAARNHRVVDDPAWLAVDAGDNVGGARVILRAPVTGTAQFASLHRLIEDLSWPVVVEDPFASINLRAHNLVPRSLSVMVTEPFTPDSPPPVEQPDITVREVQGDEQRLLAAMQELLGLPMVLCATPLGEPLYRTLGFRTALESTYWGVGNPT